MNEPKLEDFDLSKEKLNFVKEFKEFIEQRKKRYNKIIFVILWLISLPIINI